MALREQTNHVLFLDISFAFGVLIQIHIKNDIFQYPKNH